MPSNAYKTFEANLAYVDSIQSGPVKKVVKKSKSNKVAETSGESKDIIFNHTNRAALMVLCGSWEQYIKDVARDSGKAFIKSTSAWLKLHEQRQGRTDGNGENPGQSQGMPESAIATWENSHEEYINESTEKIRSPKCDNVDKIFKRTIGVTCEMFSSPDSDGRSLNEFINDRHGIVHRGVEGNKIITQAKTSEYKGAIQRLATQTDNFLRSELTKMHPEETPPWEGKAIIE